MMGGFEEIRSLFLMMIMKEMAHQRDGHTASHHEDFPPVNIMIFVAFKDDYRGNMKKDSAYKSQKIDFKFGVKIIAGN